MSPFMFVVTITSNCSGRLTSWWAQLSTITCQASISGYSGAISSNVRLSKPSVSFMMFDLVAQATAGAALRAGELERQPDDLLAALAGDQLQALGDARRLHVLDAGIQVLDVLPHHDQIDPAPGVRRHNPRQLPRRADVGVRLEQLAKRHVGALLAEPDRRLQRAFQHHPGPVDGVDGVLRHARRQSPLENLGARFALLPFDRRARRIHDPPRRSRDLGADAVAENQGDQGLAGLRWCAHTGGIPLVRSGTANPNGGHVSWRKNTSPTASWLRRATNPHSSNPTARCHACGSASSAADELSTKPTP